MNSSLQNKLPYIEKTERKFNYCLHFIGTEHKHGQNRSHISLIHSNIAWKSSTTDECKRWKQSLTLHTGTPLTHGNIWNCAYVLANGFISQRTVSVWAVRQRTVKYPTQETVLVHAWESFSVFIIYSYHASHVISLSDIIMLIATCNLFYRPLHTLLKKYIHWEQMKVSKWIWLSRYTLPPQKIAICSLLLIITGQIPFGITSSFIYQNKCEQNLVTWKAKQRSLVLFSFCLHHFQCYYYQNVILKNCKECD